MNRRFFLKEVFIGSAAAGLGFFPTELLASDKFVKITILHTNDLHSQIEPFSRSGNEKDKRGGMAFVAGMAEKFRKENPNTLLFDAGDMFQGTPYFNYFKGEPILKLMSAAGYNAGTIGNHEFDNGMEGILEGLPHAKFPLICSNYDFSDTILASKFPRWRTFRRDGLKIGVYALGIELKGLVAEKNYGKTKYIDPIEVALEMENLLKNDKNCDLIICLSHLGLRYREEKVSDMVLAAKTNETDLIIGGHTHSYLKEPLVVKNAAQKDVVVNQASWGGQVVGKIDFVFEKISRRRKNVVSENINS
jgi:5'-nucleotidase